MRGLARESRVRSKIRGRRGRMILMRSRHNGHCETCGGAITLGSVVLWSHDFGAHHPACWEDCSRMRGDPDFVAEALLEDSQYDSSGE